MIQFYTADLEQKTATLEEDEFLHCCKVLRHKEGDLISLTDGKGTKAEGKLIKIKKKNAEVELLSKNTFPKPESHLTLAVSILKNKTRWEWLLEKSVELGVDTIIPLVTQRSERNTINLERANKIMRSAALQCLRPYHPVVTESIKFKKFMSEIHEAQDKYIAHYHEDHQDLWTLQPAHSSAIIMVGPEGDFSEEEIQLCKTQNYLGVNISKNRLRTETAAIAVVQILKNLGY